MENIIFWYYWHYFEIWILVSCSISTYTMPKASLILRLLLTQLPEISLDKTPSEADPSSKYEQLKISRMNIAKPEAW